MQSVEDSATLSLCDSVTSKKASVATRNFPLSADELRKNLGLQDGSDFYLFGTTMKGEKKVVVLAKKNSEHRTHNSEVIVRLSFEYKK